MGICEILREERNLTVRILGLTVMRQTWDYTSGTRCQRFLGGLLQTEKLNNPISGRSLKIVRVCGAALISRRDQRDLREYYFLNRKIFSVSLLARFKKRYFRYFDRSHDDIYFFSANSGEVYLILTALIDLLIEKNRSRRPLLVATRPYHVDMIRMICPELPCVLVRKLGIRLESDCFRLDGFRIFLFFNSAYFKKVEYDIKTRPPGEAHYFKSMLAKLKVSPSAAALRRIKVLPEAERSMLRKIAGTGLNLDKFVFIAPEAHSCGQLEGSFWSGLVSRFRALGYDVFVNLAARHPEMSAADGCRSCFLTYAETFALARRARRIVTLRSGLTEFLLQAGVPLDVLYTRLQYRGFFNEMDAGCVMSGYGLKEVPFGNRPGIREFNMETVSPAECISRIAGDG